MPQRLTVAPCDLADANRYVARLHRHHGEVVGAKFSLLVMDEPSLVRGVAIVGRPVARHSDDGWTAEVYRVCTDGCPNACSALYGTAWRTARGMGYRRLITYLLSNESGISVRAAGWRFVGTTDKRIRRRTLSERIYPLGEKQRWEIGSPPPSPVRPAFPDVPTGGLRQRSLFDLVAEVS